MVWDFTRKGEAIFENTFTLYVKKFAFIYFSQRKPAEKRDKGTRGRRPGWGLELVGWAVV